MGTVHDLKTWPDVFEEVWSGRKTAEFRKDDRGFELLDVIKLREFNPETGQYSGRVVVAVATHVLKGGRFGFPDGYAMISLGDAIKVRDDAYVG